jgi:hypothetical protein
MPRPRAKVVTVLAIAVAALAYVAFLAAGHAIRWQRGWFVVETGPYFWSIRPNGLFVLEAVMSAVVLALFLSTRLRRFLTRSRWIETAAFALVAMGLVTLILACTYRLDDVSGPLFLSQIAPAVVVACLLYVYARAAPVGRVLRRFWLPVVAGASIALSWLADTILFGNHAVITDAHSQIWQARLLLSGRWVLDMPQAVRDVIEIPNAMRTVPTYAQYAPGHIVLLMPFLAVGLWPQVLNYLSGAATAVLATMIAARLYGRTAAVLCALLMLSSPFVWIMNASAMNHTTAALALTIAAFLLIRRRSQAAAGFALAWAFITRPLTAAAHGVVWFIDTLRGAGRVRNLLLLAAGAAAPLAFFALYNFKTTGSPLRPGYQASDFISNRLGFWSSGDYSFTPITSLHYNVTNAVWLNRFLFGWPIPLLVPVVVWFIFVRSSRGTRLLLSLVAAQVVAYSFYHFHQLLLGARMLYEIVPLAIILLSGGLAVPMRRRRPGARLLRWIFIICAIGAVPIGYSHWLLRYYPGPFRQMDEWMRQQRLDRPTVVIMPKEYPDTVGPYLLRPGDPPLYFVPKPKEAQARTLPEFTGHQFLVYDNPEY